jgi:hypothetical protein
MHLIPRFISATAAIAGVAVLAAGCGGTSPATTANSAASQPPGTFAADAYRYAACMRDHGVANFPDPQVTHSNGGTQVAIKVIGSASSPQFNAARTACRGILPMPSKSELAQQAQDRRIHTQDLVAFAHCLREHGITRFPDPDTQGQLSLQEVQADGIDLQSPAVRAAGLACVPASQGVVTRAAVLQATSGNPPAGGSSSSSSASGSNP